MNPKTAISWKDRSAILESAKAGVVPNRGQKHIQVGRERELKAIAHNLNLVAEGGASFKLVIGPYGSGKSFFLNLAGTLALGQNLVTGNADLSPDRRFHGSKRQGQSLYAEIMRNLSTRTKPTGGALPSIVQRFVTNARKAAREENTTPDEIIRSNLETLEEQVGGYEFAEVLVAYWRGSETGDGDLTRASVRWLRGEYSSKLDARRDLGVRRVVTDNNYYDYLKLFARFVRIVGYKGLLVRLDEMGVLRRLTHSQARETNYRQLLHIFNDCAQGTVTGLGFVMGGTPEFRMDTRRGLYSNEALRTRLAKNRFAKDGIVDFSGPVMELASLTPEEIYVLLRNLRRVQGWGKPETYLLPDEALEAFMAHCFSQVGAAYFETPRNTIKEFVNLLAVLEQNPQAKWEDFLGSVDLKPDSPHDTPDSDEGSDVDNDELVSFRL